jgi:hypothetical protein
VDEGKGGGEGNDESVREKEGLRKRGRR